MDDTVISEFEDWELLEEIHRRRIITSQEHMELRERLEPERSYSYVRGEYQRAKLRKHPFLVVGPEPLPEEYWMEGG